MTLTTSPSFSFGTFFKDLIQWLLCERRLYSFGCQSSFLLGQRLNYVSGCWVCWWCSQQCILPHEKSSHLIWSILRVVEPYSRFFIQDTVPVIDHVAVVIRNHPRWPGSVVESQPIDKAFVANVAIGTFRTVQTEVPAATRASSEGYFALHPMWIDAVFLIEPFGTTDFTETWSEGKLAGFERMFLRSAINAPGHMLFADMRDEGLRSLVDLVRLHFFDQIFGPLCYNAFEQFLCDDTAVSEVEWWFTTCSLHQGWYAAFFKNRVEWRHFAQGHWSHFGWRGEHRSRWSHLSSSVGDCSHMVEVTESATTLIFFI